MLRIQLTPTFDKEPKKQSFIWIQVYQLLNIKITKDLLDEGICICGADLKEDNEHKQHLEKLLKLTNPITDKSEEITVALANVKRNILSGSTKFKAR